MLAGPVDPTDGRDFGLVDPVWGDTPRPVDPPRPRDVDQLTLFERGTRPRFVDLGQLTPRRADIVD